MAIKKYYVTVDEEGNTRWYKDAGCVIRHREDGPAIEYTNGTKRWYQNGELHRENGPAVEWCDGTKEWWQNGQRHRTDGPAIEFKTGGKNWWQNDQIHRTDGPAVEWADGTKEWYINGVRMTDAEFLAATQPVVELTVADVEKLVGKRVEIIM